MPAVATGAVAGRIGIKEVGLLGCTLLVCGCLHLLFPDRIENWKSARLGSLLSYPYNTDSGEYAFLVVTFPHGLKEHEARALRPLYPGLAFLVYQPLRLLERWIPEKICRQAAVLTAEGGGASVWKGVDLRDMVTAWAALIVVNVVLYMTSLLLILSSLRRVFPPSLALLLTMVPATQRNAIDFLLVPATDVFNVLLPAIFLYTATALWSKKRGGLATALALGVGVLGKGVLYPFCNWLYEHLAVRDWRRGWRTALLCTSLFALPTLLYLGLAWLTGMTNWSHDVNVARDRDFIWMIDDLRKGMFAAIPWRWLSSLGTHLRQFVVGWPVPLVLCAVLALRKDVAPFVLGRDLKRHLVFYVVAAAAFFVLGPFLYPRLSICYYPAVVVLLGVLAARKLARPGVVLLLAVVAQMVVFAVVNQFQGLLPPEWVAWLK